MKDAQKPDHISLNTLIGRLREGRFVIPDFQRCTSSNQSGPLRLRRKRDFPPLCRVVRRPLILSPSCS